MYGNRRLVSVFDRPDDVFRSPRRVAAKEDTGPGRHERFLVDDRHVPLVELEACVAFDPRKTVFLTDGEDHVITGQDHRVDDFALLLAAFLIPAQSLELHPRQTAIDRT